MDKRKKVEDFLWYGGNELFSTLMGDNIKRSEGIDRLISLLCYYSDRCRFINGKSKAYRAMLFKAKENGWLGVHSNDLYSCKLTSDDRERILNKVYDHIKSGGIFVKRIKAIGIALSVICILALSGFLIYKKVSSDINRKLLGEYYKEQIIIEYNGKTGENIALKIHTTDNAPIFIHMEHMPKIYFVTSSSEIEFSIKEDKDIHSQEDDRADYTSIEEILTLNEKDYGTTFFPGKYRVEFEFYYVNENSERIDFPKKEIEFTVG